MKASKTINKCKKEIKARLGRPGGSEAMVHAIGIFHRHTDQLLRQRLREPPAVTFACQKGCDFCCISMRVEALPPEVLHIARYLDELPASRRQQMIERLEKHAVYARGKTYREYHARCPFLGDNGVCGIYAVRPRICRTHLSTSRSACETPGNARPDPALQQAANDLAVQVIELYKQQGLCMHPAELGQAVLQALHGDEIKTRWLNGEDVFERLPEGIVL